MSYLRPISIAIAGLAIGCAQQAASPARAPQETFAVGESAVDDSVLCEQIADRFVGLPALAMEPSADPRPRPLVGRWWLRACSLTLEKDDLRVRLRGPGWYFVDENDGDLALRQQVPFDLGIELYGHVNVTSANGVVSLRFAPDKEPKVDLRVSGELDVRPRSAWGSFLSVMPLVSLQTKAAERFTEAAGEALRRKLREGATVTYDLGAGQADATLGKLAAGQSPVNAFRDRIRWLINDRLSLDGSALHVVGPIDPGPTRLDVTVERGAGVAYRTLCVQDMPNDYSALARGDAAAVRPDSRMVSGTVAGEGQHTSDFQVKDCKFYLVVTALKAVNTLVSLRVRA